jgi:hypothetical protein
MHVGVTASSGRVTPAQLRKFGACLADIKDNSDDKEFWLHHGDCIEGDAKAHKMAIRHDFKIHLHPPIDNKKRAYVKHYDECEPAYDYLVRNKHIVFESAILFGMPDGFEEQLRSGTWSTVRFARNLQKPLVIIFPDGSTQANVDAMDLVPMLHKRRSA